MSNAIPVQTQHTTPVSNESAPPVIKNTSPTPRRRGYKKEAANAKALTQTTAWLKAAGISFKSSEVAGCDLSVQKSGGGRLEVAVVISHDIPVPIGSNLVVLACELTSRHSATALRAFQSITVAAGYGARKPIDRGPEPTKKLHFDDNFELVAMRHKEFRKVPNPTAEELLAFDRVINKAVSRFLFINKKICIRHALQAPDLKTYAQMWTCNFLGLYKVANPTDNDNERKLYAHLCQRFGNFVEILLKKERNCIPDANAVAIALTGKPYEPWHGRQGQLKEEVEQTFEEAMEAELDAEVIEPEADAFLDPEQGLSLLVPMNLADAEEKERTVSDGKRRKEAQQKLREALGQFGHDKLIEVLEATAANASFCYDARAEAKKQLRLHREDCPTCSHVKE